MHFAQSTKALASFFAALTLGSAFFGAVFGTVGCSDTVGSGTGGTGAVACPQGHVACGTTCSNPQSDPFNCGSCGTACGAGLVCSLGACSDSCAAGLAVCGAACEDVLTSPYNCGACGNVCAGGVCAGGVCDGATGAGGASGTGGAAGTGSASGAGAASGIGLFGGYHSSGDWSGFAFAFASGGATVTPSNFEDMIDVDGPYCIQGTVPGTAPTYSAIAAVGVHTNQEKAENAPILTLAPQGDGLAIDITVNGGSKTIRIQLEDETPPTDPNAAEHRWCVNLTADSSNKIQQVVPWESFNTQCWATTGTAYAKQPLARAIAYVPDPGTGSATFDFCLNDIGPDSVASRGTGAVVASCGNSVTWSASTLSGTQDAQSSGNTYRAQANFWNPVNGSFQMSLLSSAGFKMDTQSCNTTTDSPCSFPSIYIGVDGSGDRSSGNGLPKVVNTINSIPTCLGWNAGGTPASHEYNVSYDVWFNGNQNAAEAEQFLMIWFRDPPSFQPAGMFPVQNGVVVGSQTWTLWHGPNHQNRPTTSFVAPNAFAQGQAYQFDLMDFIDEAAERGYIDKSKYLISVMGGLEIWGGGQGASITGFKAEIQ